MELTRGCNAGVAIGRQHGANRRPTPAAGAPMIELEARLTARYPTWFTGPRARLTRPLLRGFGRLSRLERINAFLASHGHLRGHGFVEAALDFLKVRYCVDHVERERIPETGATVIVANHPSGALDALALLHLVGTVRRDVRIVANDLLCAIEPLADLLLPLRVLGGAPSASSVGAVTEALERGECVIVFPAGEVSRLGLRGIRDGRWRRGFVRFARDAGAAVVPVRVEARNSALFHGASMLFKPAGTALLAREMFGRDGRRLQLRVGMPLRLPGGDDTATVVALVRRALQAIGSRRESLPAEGQPLVHAVDRGRLIDALAQLPLLGHTPDGKHIHAGPLDADSPLLREIGRLREQCFRAVGEGTGQRLDIDRFDTWYDHIVLWDPQALQVAGAYRVAPGARVLAQRGLDGLYSASLFRYSAAQLPRLAQGMELGRSFVAPGYQGTRCLDELWLGIGAYLRRHPQVRYLFGPVSISARLPLPAREQLVAYYQRYFAAGDEAGATANRPFGFQAAAPDFRELDADTAFRVLKANLGALGARVPTLYKQYTELCEPGGVRFLAFGVDPDFNHSVDGLIELDLARIRPRKRQRYIEAPAVASAGVAA